MAQRPNSQLLHRCDIHLDIEPKTRNLIKIRISLFQSIVTTECVPLLTAK